MFAFEKRSVGLAFGLLGASASGSAMAGSPTLLTEIRVDQPGTDNDEFFEIAGSPGFNFNEISLVVIGDGSGGSGVIDEIVDLTGLVMPLAGFVVIAESTFTLGDVDLEVVMNFENGDNMTFLLVEGVTAAVGDDLDTNDDGVLDSEPWKLLLDLVAFSEPENPSGGIYHYGPPALCAEGEDCATVGPDGTFFPGAAARCDDLTGPWVITPFDVTLGGDTPGSIGPCPTPADEGAGDMGIDLDAGVDADVASDSGFDATLDFGFGPDVGTDGGFVFDLGFDFGGGDDGGFGFDFGFDAADFGFDADATVDAGSLEDADVSLPEAAVFNEIRIDMPGEDTEEYVEIVSAPNTSLAGLTIVIIGDGATGSGFVEEVYDLVGATTGSDGILLIGSSTFSLATPDIRETLSLENSDNITILLVAGNTLSLGDDIDSNDDGALDGGPYWDEIYDLVAVVREANPPTATEYHYGPPALCAASATCNAVGPSGAFAPSAIARCPNGDGDWTIGTFEVSDSDTPGAPNDCGTGGGDPEPDAGGSDAGDMGEDFGATDVGTPDDVGADLNLGDFGVSEDLNLGDLSADGETPDVSGDAVGEDAEVGTPDAGGEDTGGEDTGGEDTGGEDTGGGDTGGEDTGGEDTGTGNDVGTDGGADAETDGTIVGGGGGSDGCDCSAASRSSRTADVSWLVVALTVVGLGRTRRRRAR
jgi:MYXO-CTERM domain-containing protein